VEKNRTRNLLRTNQHLVTASWCHTIDFYLFIVSQHLNLLPYVMRAAAAAAAAAGGLVSISGAGSAQQLVTACVSSDEHEFQVPCVTVLPTRGPMCDKS
jgi:hypothetical protein